MKNKKEQDNTNTSHARRSVRNQTCSHADRCARTRNARAQRTQKQKVNNNNNNNKNNNKNTNTNPTTKQKYQKNDTKTTCAGTQDARTRAESKQVCSHADRCARTRNACAQRTHIKKANNNRN